MKKEFALDIIIPRLLQDQLSPTEFESITEYYWSQGDFLQPSPNSNLAQTIKKQALACSSFNYKVPTSTAHFKTQRLFGKQGSPTALHIIAPGEVHSQKSIQTFNRPPHWHESGRISIITEKQAILYILRTINDIEYVIKAPVTVNDIIFWPARVIHTFDAGISGFSLLSAMPSGCAPDAKEFAQPAPFELENLAQISYQDYQLSF